MWIQTQDRLVLTEQIKCAGLWNAEATTERSLGQDWVGLGPRIMLEVNLDERPQMQTPPMRKRLFEI